MNVRQKTERFTEFTVKPSQKIAAAVSSAAFTLFNIVIYYVGLLSVEGISEFMFFKMPSVMVDYQPWFSMTFAMYLFLNALIILVLSFSVALITSWVSLKSKNYIDLLLKIIIEYFVLRFTVMYGYAFYFESAPNDLTGLPNSDVTYVVLLLCVAIILCIVSVKNQAKKDLL